MRVEKIIIKIIIISNLYLLIYELQQLVYYRDDDREQ